MSLDTTAGLKITNQRISKIVYDFNATSQKIFDKQISFEGHKHTVADFTDWATSKINWNRIENAPDFLQKSGGTMTGDIVLPTQSGINNSAVFSGEIPLGSEFTNTLRQSKSFLGNIELQEGATLVKNSIISVRHKNGDHSNGLYLRCPNKKENKNNLYWCSQTDDDWGAERKLWDAINLTQVSQLNNDAGYLTTHKKLEKLIQEEIVEAQTGFSNDTEFLTSYDGKFSDTAYKPAKRNFQSLFSYIKYNFGTPWTREIIVIKDLLAIVNKDVKITRENINNLFVLDLEVNRNSYVHRTFGFHFETELLNSQQAIEFTAIVNTRENENFDLTFWSHLNLYGTKFVKMKANSQYLVRFYSMNNDINFQNNVRNGYIIVEPLFVDNNINTYKSNYDLQKDIEKKESKIDYISHVSDTNKEQSVTIRPHQYHKYGELTKLTIQDDGTNPTDTLVEFMFCFETGTAPFILELPPNVKKPTQFEFIPNHVYQMSIIDNILQYGALAVR